MSLYLSEAKLKFICANCGQTLGKHRYIDNACPIGAHAYRYHPTDTFTQQEKEKDQSHE